MPSARHAEGKKSCKKPNTRICAKKAPISCFNPKCINTHSKHETWVFASELGSSNIRKRLEKNQQVRDKTMTETIYEALFEQFRPYLLILIVALAIAIVLLFVISMDTEKIKRSSKAIEEHIRHIRENEK